MARLTFDEFAKRVSVNVGYLLRDFEYANVLHEGKEFKYEDEVKMAVLRAQGEIESIPPFLPFEYDAFIEKNAAFQNFTKLVAAALLDSESARQMRNESNSAQTNTQTGILDKSMQYSQFATKLRQEAMPYFQVLVRKLNTLGGFGGVVTGAYLNRYGF